MLSVILDQLRFCHSKRFTGKLCATSLYGDAVDSLEGHCWNIHFYRGRLIGDSNGIHPLRRLQRQFLKQRISLPEEVENNILKSLSFNCLSFDAVSQLVLDQYLDREQAEKILAASLIEVLFDIFHYEALAKVTNKNQLLYILESNPSQELNLPDILMKPEIIWETALLQFQLWEANELLEYSPHLSPQVNTLDLSQEILPTKIFQNIVLHLEGSPTLRDLAVKIDEEVIFLTKSLLELSKENAVFLRQTTDIDLIDKKLRTEIEHTNIYNFSMDGSDLPIVSQKKLIVHLTQNSTESWVIQNIVEKAGHKYLNCREYTQALLTFLKCSPDLIVMDNASAGIPAPDLCDRLRRTNKFKTTPIVMISKGSSIIEHLRSNSVDYVCKPLSQQKIFSFMNKYVM
jgi:two-component system, chemotaxis family, response regulator PixG